jgi:PAS domain S-box-containing protein
MKRPSARFFVTLGLGSLLASVLLLAMYLEIVPDSHAAIRHGRAALAEAIAVNTSALIGEKDGARAQAVLKFVVDRNPDLLSAAVIKGDAEPVAVIGEHAQHWKELPGGLSTDSQIQVPILAGSQKWGRVELRFEPLRQPGWLGALREPRVEMIGFVVLFAAISFYYYLGRVLRQLDPSRAIPGRVRAAFDTMAEGLLVIDPKGYIMLANQAFGEVVGQPADKLIAKLATGFAWLGPDGSALAPDACPWTATLRDGQAQRHVLVRLTDSDAKVRSFMVNCSPVMGASGKPQGVLISFDDVTALQEKEVELRIAKDQAEEANRSKSDFLANMSHEIRTPMNAILGFADVLRRGLYKGEGEMRRHLNTIHSSGKHLLDLINDILDLAKVESGRMEVERIECAPHQVIQEVVEVLGVRAREKGIGLQFECSGPVPEKVLTDPGRVRQIVTNLAGNAIKFTQSGVVKIVQGVRTDAGRALLTIDVVDTGVGIPADKLESIFEPFTQAESSTTRRFGGTGLGLTISRKFARALGGDIVAHSVIGQGSVFSVTLDPGPLAGVRMLQPEEALARTQEAGPVEACAWQFPPARVLVVDDGEENRELVRLVLEESGLRVTQAENGQVGVDKASAEAFDLILMDMQMPVMDGYTATRTLRGRGFKAPIIALTANAMKGFEQTILEAGCSHYMTKPIDIDLLLSTLAGLLNGKRVSARPQPQAALAPAAPVEQPRPAATRTARAAGAGGAPVVTSAVGAPPIGVPVVSRLADHPRLRAVVRKFAQQMPERMRAIEEAWDARDYTTLAGLAHWLKGSGGTAGFDAFTAPARTLEQLAKAGDEASIAPVIAQLKGLVDCIVAPADEDLALAKAG